MKGFISKRAPRRSGGNGVILLALLFLLVLTRSAFGQSRERPIVLEPIIVTAEKNAEQLQTGDVDRERTPAFFSVIERDQFEGKIEDLSEVIEKEVGIQVRQAGGLGSFSTVSLRGSTSDQVLVFMDGILLNDASGGGVDLSGIALSDVGAIEIYRGVTPINFGKASIGGVVNIRTLRADKGLKINARAGYGSFNTKEFNGFVNHKPGKWDYVVSLDYLDSDNDFEFRYDNLTDFTAADDRTEKRNNAQFDRANVLSKFGFDFSDTIRLDFINQWFSKDQGLPALNNSERANASFDTKRNIATLKLTADDIGPYHFNTSTRFDFTWKEEDFDDRQNQIGLGRQHTLFTTKRYGAQFFLEWLKYWNALSLMLDFQHEKHDPDDLLDLRNPNESSRDMFAAGLQNSFILFEERLIVTPAVRFTTIDDELKSAVDAFGVPLEARSRNENYVNPQIGIKYRLRDWLTLKANLAQYVREPSLFELFGDRGFVIGNEDLEEEEGINFDAGFEINWLSTNKWLNRLALSAAYFRSEVDDLITLSFDARGIGKYRNISEARIEGFEAAINIDFCKYFRLVGNATWQDTKNRSAIRAFNGKNLPGRYEDTYLVRVEALYKGLKIYNEYVREEDLFYDTANLLKAKNKNELNAGVSWLFRSFRFSFEAKNISDHQHEDFNGFPLPGRSFFFTVKYAYELLKE